MDANAREIKIISTMIFFLEMAYALAMSKPKSFWLIRPAIISSNYLWLPCMPMSMKILRLSMAWLSDTHVLKGRSVNMEYCTDFTPHTVARECCVSWRPFEICHSTTYHDRCI
jgi:hypothetical protein